MLLPPGGSRCVCGGGGGGLYNLSRFFPAPDGGDSRPSEKQEPPKCSCRQKRSELQRWEPAALAPEWVRAEGAGWDAPAAEKSAKQAQEGALVVPATEFLKLFRAKYPF